MPANDIPQSVFAPFMDPCDIHLPLDVTGELLRCSTANGRIDYYYLLAIYRAGVAAGRAALQSPPPREAVPNDGSVMVRISPVYLDQMRGEGLRGPFDLIRLVEPTDGEPRLEFTVATPETAAMALARDLDFAIDVTEPQEVRLRRFADIIGPSLGVRQPIPPPREAAIREPWGHPDLIEGLGAAAANLRTYEWGCDLAEHCDTAAFLLTEGPPRGEADAALWPLVERLVRELDDYDLRDEIHGLEPSVADAFDALRACRPPSAPAPAVTSEGPWPMTIKTHFWCPECKGPCCVDEDALCSQCGADVVASGTPEAAALDSPPPPETQP